MAKHSLFRRKTVTSILRDIELGFGDAEHGGGLKRSLTVKDLTLMGFAAIIGAGLFSTIGTAASNGGPAVSLLFVGTAIACAFAALCYAEFASAIPISGSAYTYAYATFGELAAWIIGWDLIVEYGIGNITVAISWSDYLTTFIAGFGLDLPAWSVTDYISAGKFHTEVSEMIAALGVEADTLVQTLKANPGYEAMRALFPDPNSITRPMMEGYLAWETAPSLFGLRIIFDLPAVFIVVLITYLIYVGISESKNASNWLVYIKFGIIALVLGIGFFYVDTGNWSPFAPNGIPGVLKGVSAVFFAYIGFDALSTMSEEAKNPQRDLPRAMMYALVICTILYIVISLVLTGVVPYQQLAVGDPMAELINYTDLDPFWRNLIRGVVALGAIIATTSVLLIFQLGQPRILMSMARDGLLPKRFAKIHPRYRTPAFASIVTGFLVGLPVFFMNLAEVTDLTSIGTLFAFVLVCAGILYQQLYAGPDYQPKFKVKYINGRVWMPLLLITSAVIMFTQNGAGVSSFISFSDPEHSTAWSILRRVPLLLFMIVTVGATVLSVTHKLSLIPTLGLVLCFYLMSEVDPMSWYRFLAWLALGLVVYFSFSQKNSRLGQQRPQ